MLSLQSDQQSSIWNKDWSFSPFFLSDLNIEQSLSFLHYWIWIFLLDEIWNELFHYQIFGGKKIQTN